MGIKDTEQDQTMMDGPEHSSHTGEGGGGVCVWGGDIEKMEICVGGKRGGGIRNQESGKGKES